MERERNISTGDDVSVREKARRVGPEMTNNLDSVSLNGYAPRARVVRDEVIWVVFLAPADMMILAGKQDQGQIRTEELSDSGSKDRVNALRACRWL
jgi:hypothetical protein